MCAPAIDIPDDLRPCTARIRLEMPDVSALHSAFSNRQPLSTGHILSEIRRAVPLSRTCREAIEELREWAKGRTVSAG